MVNEHYKKMGWHIKRVWEHDIKKDFDKVIIELLDFINKAKKSNT